MNGDVVLHLIKVLASKALVLTTVQMLNSYHCKGLGLVESLLTISEFYWQIFMGSLYQGAKSFVVHVQ